MSNEQVASLESDNSNLRGEVDRLKQVCIVIRFSPFYTKQKNVKKCPAENHTLTYTMPILMTQVCGVNRPGIVLCDLKNELTAIQS